MRKKKCPHCQSENIRKRGFMKSKRGKTARYQCKDCNKTFTKRTGTINHRHRKQHLRDKLKTLYCEGMSLRAIARAEKINFKTVVRYFLENSEVSKSKTTKALDKGSIYTSYIQFDELETFEHTKKKPLGVQVSIRWKTGEIISTKVCKIPVKALSVSKSYIEKWNKNIDRKDALISLFQDTKKSFKKDYCLLAGDSAPLPLKVANDLFQDDKNIQVHNSKERNKRIDLVFLKMRQDISRLRRKTLATTKKRDNLQRHLDLYTDYHNEKRIA